MSNLYQKYYDISKLVIWGDSDSTDQSSKRPRLVFSFRDGNPRISVYTGNSGVEGIISFPSDIPTMVSAMSMLKDVANGPNGNKVAIDSLTVNYVNNKPTNEKKLVSTLYIGKSKEGLVYLSVITEGKPKLVFSIKPSQYHTFKDSEKNVISDSVISPMMAKGIADVVLNVVSNILITYTNEEYNNSGRKQSSTKPNTSNGASNDSYKTDSSKSDILSSLEDLNL